MQHLRSPGLLTVHVYAYSLHKAPSERPTPGHIVSQQPVHEQKTASHITETASQFSGQVSSADQSLGDGDNSSDEAEQHRHQQEASELSAAPVDAATEGLSLLDARRVLVLSAEVNLDELHAIQDDLPALDVCLPPNTLILELTDGLCLFPSLSLCNASSDSAALADKAAASVPVVPGASALLDQAEHAIPDTGSVSEQVCSLKRHW